MDTVSSSTVPDASSELTNVWTNHPQTHPVLLTDEVVGVQGVLTACFLRVHWLVVE